WIGILACVCSCFANGPSSPLYCSFYLTGFPFFLFVSLRCNSFLTPFVSAVPFGPVRSYPRPLFVGFAVVPSSPVLPPFRFGLFGTLFTAMPRVVTLSLAGVVGSERSRFVVGTVCSGGSVGGTGNLTPKLFLGTSCLFISLF
ncbi:putative transmembrane protein, partial [Toxoplasma gondii VEG]